VHEVTVAPFLLSKYEMTQAQWQRTNKDNPSVGSRAGRRWGDVVHDLRHPVESVSWLKADETAWRLGLSLPTEAQWEYGCRGGTSTVWSSGDDIESLEGFVNLSDLSILDSGKPVTWEVLRWRDGYGDTAPVGTFRANRFGLHDMIGNLWEWCRDGDADYDVPARPGDGLRVAAPSDEAAPEVRAARGGDFSALPGGTRCARRARFPLKVSMQLTLRPARALEITPSPQPPPAPRAPSG
jgi:formylglycine-generating enzyme required for sulfatase activity